MECKDETYVQGLKAALWPYSTDLPHIILYAPLIPSFIKYNTALNCTVCMLSILSGLSHANLSTIPSQNIGINLAVKKAVLAIKF